MSDVSVPTRTRLPGPRLPRPAQGLRMLATEHRMLARYRRRYGELFALNIWPFDPLVVVSDPAEVKRIFTGDPAQLHAGEGNAVLEPIVGPQSVLLLDEAAHLRQRKLLLPSFHGDRMRVYGELMREIADAEIDSWPLHEEFPVHPSMQRITLRVILRAVFGMEDAERSRRLEDLLVEMLNLGQRVVMVPLLQHEFGGIGPWSRFRRVRAAVDEILLEEIARARGASDLEERADVLALLLAAREPDGRGLSDAEVRDELVTLLVAGYETTATAMSWTVERVLRHPAVLSRIQDELAAEETGYLDCVVKETMRVRPVITYVMRRLTAPMDVGGYTVPAGATLGTSITLLHRRPEIYPEPFAFRPERFEDRAPDTYSWVPLGGGIRRCLGAAFAGYEMSQVLGRVFTRCDLRAAQPRGERPARRIITFVPDRGAAVVMRSREPGSASAAARERVAA